MSAPKYGKRNVPKMIREVEALRQLIHAEGTPAIQDAWDKVEEHIDYAYRADLPPTLAAALALPEVAALVEALRDAVEALEWCARDRMMTKSQAALVKKWADEHKAALAAMEVK